MDSAKEEVYLELQDMYTRHSHKLFLWRGLWPTFLRQNLSDRLLWRTLGTGQIQEDNHQSGTAIGQAVLHDSTGNQRTLTQSSTANNGTAQPAPNHTVAAHTADTACTQGAYPWGTGDPTRRSYDIGGAHVT